MNKKMNQVRHFILTPRRYQNILQLNFDTVMILHYFIISSLLYYKLTVFSTVITNYISNLIYCLKSVIFWLDLLPTSIQTLNHNFLIPKLNWAVSKLFDFKNRIHSFIFHDFNLKPTPGSSLSQFHLYQTWSRLKSSW